MGREERGGNNFLFTIGRRGEWERGRRKRIFAMCAKYYNLFIYFYIVLIFFF
jgi:hypothetical protein